MVSQAIKEFSSFRVNSCFMKILKRGYERKKVVEGRKYDTNYFVFNIRLPLHYLYKYSHLLTCLQ